MKEVPTSVAGFKLDIDHIVDSLLGDSTIALYCSSENKLDLSWLAEPKIRMNFLLTSQKKTFEIG